MKNLLKLEELAQFAFCLVALIVLHAPWWVYPLLLVGPDVSMLGYLVNTRTGAFCYNLFHHKAIGVSCLAMAAAMGYGQRTTEGLLQEGSLWLIVGIILYGHASMDRIFGYGLKFGDSFQHTHLGWIGRSKERA